MMLYSTAKPDCNTAGFRDPSVRALLGKATPTKPVIASGLINDNPRDKSPKPLPKNSPGVHVLKASAPTCLLPVPPTSTSRPIETTASCSSFSKNSYFEPMERLLKPFTALPSEGLSMINASPNSMSHFGVMRSAMSEETSVSRVPPLSGVTMPETVGSDNSSATNGSSVESVAGKNLLPAKPCAEIVSGGPKIMMRETVTTVKAALLSGAKMGCVNVCFSSETPFGLRGTARKNTRYNPQLDKHARTAVRAHARRS